MKPIIIGLTIVASLIGGAKELMFFQSKSDVALVTYSGSGVPEVPVGEGRITGRVSVTKSSSSAGRPAKGLYGKTTSRLSKSGASDKRAVVFIKSVPGKFPVPQSRPAMRQKNISIVPHVLPVLLGTTVDFPNEDEIYHNIFSLSSSKSFDLGRYAKGLSKSITFTKTGEVKVFCDIHSQMSAYIWVMQNPYFATCSADGEYSIQGVPSGNYDLVAWHESGGKQTRPIRVDGGQDSKMDFSL